MPNQHLIQLVDSLSLVLSSTVSFLRENGAAISGDEPTDCPGWTVKDHLSHMVGLEQVLAGSPLPDVELPNLPHVVTELDEYMELPVQARRPLPLVSVIDEMAGMTNRRMSTYRQLIDGGEQDVPGPLGRTRPLSEALERRLFDLWTHEQDIRRACGHPIRDSDETASGLVIDTVLGAWAKVLPEHVTDDGILRVNVADYASSDIEMIFGDGGPVAVLGLDLTEVYRLACGRGTTDDILRKATVAGARDLLNAVLPHLNISL